MDRSKAMQGLASLAMAASTRTKQVFGMPYRQHLSENVQMTERLAEKCMEKGSIIKLIAPCGAGKTHLVLCELAKRLEDQRQIILLNPNKIQTEQNAIYGFVNKSGVYRSTEVVVGGKGEFSFDKKFGISSVYDSIARLYRPDYQGVIRDGALSDTVLVIDEVHQLFSAKDYRGRCVTILEHMIQKVVEAGGSVLYITGTPRKIEGRPADYIFNGIHIDETGTPIPRLDTGRIRLVRNTSHTYNMADCVFSVTTALIRQGKIPLIRLNDKRKILSLSSMLRQQGYTCLTLTSNDKDYYIDKDRHVIVYDSMVYQNILEKAALPAADCYIVTSVMEVGTSIRQIMDFDGPMHVPDNLVPVYVCRNPDDCDLDDMQQFFARPRFHTPECVIYMNKLDNRNHAVSHMPDPEEEILRVYENAYLTMEGLCRAGAGRESMPDIHGNQEGMQGIARGINGRLEENYANIRAYGWKKYYACMYYYPEYAEEMLKREFKIPIEICELTTSSISAAPAAKAAIDPQLISLLHSLAGSNDFMEALTEPDGIYNTDEIRKVRKMEHGMLMLQTIRSILPGRSFSYHEAVELAKESITADKTLYVASRHIPGKKLPLKEEVVHGCFLAMADWKNYYAVAKYMAAQRYAYGKTRGILPAKARNPVKLEKDQEFCIRFLENSEYFQVFLDMLDATNGTRSWNYICHFAATNHLDACRRYIRMVYHTRWNRMEDNSRELEQATAYREMISGAEYICLRYPERYFFTQDGTGKKLFPDGLKGRTVTMDDCRQIADQMKKAVASVYSGRSRIHSYTAKEIFQAIYLIWRVRSSHGKWRDRNGQLKFVVEDLRKRETGLPEEFFSDERAAEEIDGILFDGNRPTLDPITIHEFEPVIRKRIAAAAGSKAAASVTREITKAVCQNIYQKGDALFLIRSARMDEHKEPIPIAARNRILTGTESQLPIGIVSKVYYLCGITPCLTA